MNSSYGVPGIAAVVATLLIVDHQCAGASTGGREHPGFCTKERLPAPCCCERSAQRLHYTRRRNLMWQHTSRTSSFKTNEQWAAFIRYGGRGRYSYNQGPGCSV